MKYSNAEVMEYVREEDVKFIRIAFCDVFGRQKNISIMPDRAAKGMNWAARLAMLIRRWPLGSGLGRSIMSS